MSTANTRDYWEQLVTCAMLGSDRREPPQPPPGPFADLAADDPQPAAAERMAQQIAAVAVARRSGLRPESGPAPTAAPDVDERPPTPPAASHRWRELVARWPVLEDEWLVAVLAFGWRLSPELVPALLRRHRTHPLRTARVLAAAGPLAGWLVDQMAELAPTAVVARASADRWALMSLPDLPIPPDLALLVRAGDDAPGSDEVVAALCEPVRHGRVPAAHLRALANVVARVPLGALPAIAAALDTHPLGEMAAMRAAMIADLNPSTPAEEP